MKRAIYLLPFVTLLLFSCGRNDSPENQNELQDCALQIQVTNNTGIDLSGVIINTVEFGVIAKGETSFYTCIPYLYDYTSSTANSCVLKISSNEIAYLDLGICPIMQEKVTTGVYEFEIEATTIDSQLLLVAKSKSDPN